VRDKGRPATRRYPVTLLDELAHPVGHDSCREEFSSDDVDADVGARDVLLELHRTPSYE